MPICNTCRRRHSSASRCADVFCCFVDRRGSLVRQGSAFLGTEFNRIRAGKPPIKFARRAKGPPQDASDVAGWEAALASAKAELGYQNAKMIHLQLLKKYGKDAWVAHNDDVVQTKELLEREAETVKIEVNQINFNRKREHERAGAKLDAMESKHWATVHNIDAVSVAVEDLAKRLRGDQ